MKEKYVIYDNELAEDDGLVTVLAIVSNEADAQEFIMDETLERMYRAFIDRLHFPHTQRRNGKIHTETVEEIIEMFVEDSIARWSWHYIYSKAPVMED